MPSRKGDVQQSEASAGLFRRHTLIDLHKKLYASYRVNTFIRGSRTGNMFVGKFPYFRYLQIFKSLSNLVTK